MNMGSFSLTLYMQISIIPLAIFFIFNTLLCLHAFLMNFVVLIFDI